MKTILNKDLINKNNNKNYKDSLINYANDKLSLFQLVHKFDFNSYTDKRPFKTIHEISNKRFGILLNTRFIIISYKTFQKIKTI